VWLLDDLGPVPFCGEARDDHKPSDCPPWCVADHRTPFDREHDGELYGVPLDAHPYQVRVASGEWETERMPVLVSLSQLRPDRELYISLVGQSGTPEAVSHLTAHEADQLAEILHKLAATLRGARHDLVTAKEDAR
jgi:hypothetical protein